MTSRGSAPTAPRTCAGSARSGPAITTTQDSAPGTRIVAAVAPLVPAWRLERTFDYLVPEGVEVGVGMLVRVPLGGRRVRGLVTAVAQGVPGRELQEIAAVIVAVPLCDDTTLRLLYWIADRYAAHRARSLALVVPPRVRIPVRPVAPRLRPLDGHSLASYGGGPELAGALSRGEAGAWCVRPSAGHDTAVLVADIVSLSLGTDAARGAVLVAVPEIAHGSGILDALADRFGAVARLDSARPPAERAAGMLALAAGHPLGAGGRSVVVAPASRLACLVVVDEHNRAYKEDRAPRYDARVVAAKRARLQEAALVVVDATPLLETAAAVRAGQVRVVEPSRSELRSARPLVEVVAPPEGRTLSDALHTRIHETLRAGQRVALLAARRGYAGAMWCAACRRSLRCARCDAVVASSRVGRAVRCLRCGHTAPAPAACPSCRASDWRMLGAGTERLEEQLGAAFPRARVVRMDADVGTQGGRVDADIYVTTWIGTKPEIRPEVSFVGVLDADALVRRPDWRSSESAFHALAEMAAWAGPAGEGGRLMIHTADPGHHAVQAVARADYWYFVERELPLREELGYPPYRELVKMTAAGAEAPAFMQRLVDLARAEHAQVLGPIAVVRGAHQGLEALVKCDDAEGLAVGARGILAAAPAGTIVRMDVDPR